MAKKKSSSSKITITKATTVKTPTIKSYTPSKAVNAAKSTLQKTEKARPAAYTSKYGTQITGLADAIANRKGFSYDYTKDALYQNYKDQYQRQAQLGMQNATAQAAALSASIASAARPETSLLRASTSSFASTSLRSVRSSRATSCPVVTATRVWFQRSARLKICRTWRMVVLPILC